MGFHVHVKCKQNLRSIHTERKRTCSLIFLSFFTVRKPSCGKVMFLHLSVCRSQGGGGLPRGICIHGGSASRGGVWEGVLPPGGSAYLCIQRGRWSASGEGGVRQTPSGTRKAGGTHPPGMLSCSLKRISREGGTFGFCLMSITAFRCATALVMVAMSTASLLCRYSSNNPVAQTRGL